MVGEMTDSITRLHQAVLAARTLDPATSRTARLLRSSRAKMAKKLAEEAVEVVIDAMHGDNDAVVRESADLLYNLVVLWVSSGVDPQDIWDEMMRREKLLGIAEKLPKIPKIPAVPQPAAGLSQPVATLNSRRAQKRR
jgi:phosphoribosyl-ATP pyrophosphohydrolase